ncbi:MAG: YciI family protein [Caulobacteraceae bacterium]
MRYMYLVSAAENGAPPPQRLMEEMDKLAKQELAAGRMISQGGLLPTAMGSARVELRRGKVKVTDGPFAETKEVLGGFAIFDFATREQAIASAINFMELHAKYAEGWEGVCEMRPMFAEEGCAAQVAVSDDKVSQPA